MSLVRFTDGNKRIVVDGKNYYSEEWLREWIRTMNEINIENPCVKKDCDGLCYFEGLGSALVCLETEIQSKDSPECLEEKEE